eukprot:4362543-Prymnesium_polylepis.1
MAKPPDRRHLAAGVVECSVACRPPDCRYGAQTRLMATWCSRGVYPTGSAVPPTCRRKHDVGPQC